MLNDSDNTSHQNVVRVNGHESSVKKGRLASLRSWPRSRWMAVIFVLAFAGIGTAFLLRGSADTPLSVAFQVSTHQSDDTESISSPTFTTKNGELLLAFIDSNGPGQKATRQSIQSVTSGGLTWTLRTRANAQLGTAEIWQAVANQSITTSAVAKRTVKGYSGSIRVVGFTGADTSIKGAASTSSGLTGAASTTLTTTRAGSWVWATGNDWDDAINRSTSASQTIIDQYVYTGESTTYWTQRQTMPTALANTKITMSTTTPTEDRWNFVAVEVLPINNSGGTTGGGSTTVAPPTNLVGSVASPTKVSLSWTASASGSSVANYEIYRNGTKLATTTNTTYSDTTTTPSTAYTYYVDAASTTKTTSIASNTVSITTPTASCPAGQIGTPPNCSPGTSSSGWWKPGTGQISWQWEIDHEISTTNATDMGTDAKTYTGAAAVAPAVFDIDGFNNSAADVSSLHTQGKKVICYIEVGAIENYRPDYAQFPATSMGSGVQGYPSEKYLDINNPTVVQIIKSRIDMCHSKGFDAIEPDIDDSYTDNTGFTISLQNNVDYLTNLSAYAHSLGMSWGLKNGGDGGDPTTFVTKMLPNVDFAVTEEPYFLKTIGFFHPAFLNAGKAMFVAEYTPNTSSAADFCTQSLTDHTDAVLYDLNLDGKTRETCF